MKFVLLSLFVLSGATSLVYETLWIRVLSLGVGSTSASMSLVLAVFFLGLSVGSYLSGKFTIRVRSPILAYGLIEGVIGLYALFVLSPLFHLHRVLALLPLESSVGWIALLVKLILVSGLLAIPTIAMGATLPLLVRIFLGFGYSVGGVTGLLYGINTIGAVLGALLTSFFLIPKLGIPGANLCSAFVNLTVFVGTLWLARKEDWGISSGELGEAQAARTAITPLQKAILIASGACGFVSIASEVVWNKYLGIFFGTNIYGLGLILSLYLLGIASGSLVLAKVADRITEPVKWFVRLFAAALVLMLATGYAFNYLPQLTTLLHHYLGGLLSLLTIKSLVTAAILFLPTSAFGALLPLGILILSPDRRSAPRLLGLAYAINTCGAILGSYLGGIVLIPLVGSSQAIRIVLVVGAGALAWVVRKGLTSRQRVPAYAFVALLVLSTTLVPGLDFRNILKSAYHRHVGEQSLSEAMKRFSRDYEEFNLIIEGETAIISLSHDPADGAYFRSYERLKTNGLNESVYNRLRPKQLPKYEALIAVLPYVLTASPKRAFVVGYGGGFTVDFLTLTELEKVDVIELEKGILRAADYVHRGKNPLLQRKNLNLRIEDARYVLATKQSGPHDIIISQPSHSWLTGAANLFTKDFFEIVKEALTEGGVFSQWLNLYNMDVKVLKSILRTFFSVFPEGAVFTNIADQELVLIGSRKPLELKWDRLERLVSDPAFREGLSGIPLSNPYDLLSQFAFSRQDILRDTAGSILNTDGNAYAEVNQSLLFYRADEHEITPQQFLSRAFSGEYAPWVPEEIRSSPNFLYYVLTSFDRQVQYDKFHSLLRRYEMEARGHPGEQWHLGYLALKAKRFDSAVMYLRRAMERSPRAEVLDLWLSALLEMGREDEAASLARKYKTRDAITDCYLGEIALRRSDARARDGQFKKLVSDVSGYTKACGDYYNRIVGLYYAGRNEMETALGFLEAYAKVYSGDPEHLLALARAYRAMGQRPKADQTLAMVKSALDAELKSLVEMSDYYRKSHLLADAAALDSKAARLRSQSPLLAE